MLEFFRQAGRCRILFKNPRYKVGFLVGKREGYDEIAG